LLCMPCSWVLLGCFMYSSLSISSSSLNIMAYNPTRTTSANHSDLLQYLLTSFISAG
jgi:hypothetical protein